MPLDLVYLAVAALLAPALGEVAKIRSKAAKAFTWMGVGGVLFVLAASFQVVSLDLLGLGGLSGTLASIFSLLGLLSVLVGAVLASVGLLSE